MRIRKIILIMMAVAVTATTQTWASAMEVESDPFMLSQFATMYKDTPWNPQYKKWHLDLIHRSYRWNAFIYPMSILRSEEYAFVSDEEKYAAGIDSLMRKRALQEILKMGERNVNLEKMIEGKRADEERDKLRKNIQALNRYSYGTDTNVNGWEMLLGAFRNEMDAIDEAYMPQGCRKAAYSGLCSFLQELNMSVERDIARCRAETAIMDLRRDNSKLHRYSASYYTDGCLKTFLGNVALVNSRRE